MDREDTNRKFSLASTFKSKANVGKEDTDRNFSLPSSRSGSIATRSKPSGESSMDESVVDVGESVVDESSIDRNDRNLANTQKRDTKGDLKVTYGGSIVDTEDDGEGHKDDIDMNELEEYEGLWYRLQKRLDILSMFVACGLFTAVLVIVSGVLVYFYYDEYCAPQVAVLKPVPDPQNSTLNSTEIHTALAVREAADFRNTNFYSEKCGCVTITTKVEMTQVKCSRSGNLKDVYLPNDGRKQGAVQIGRCPEYIRGKPCNNRGGVCTQMMYSRNFAVESDDPAYPVSFCSQMFPYYCMCS